MLHYCKDLKRIDIEEELYKISIYVYIMCAYTYIPVFYFIKNVFDKFLLKLFYNIL